MIDQLVNQPVCRVHSVIHAVISRLLGMQLDNLFFSFVDDRLTLGLGSFVRLGASIYGEHARSLNHHRELNSF